MAWEEFDTCGMSGTTGDRPVDAMASGLVALRKAYQDRWKRLPTVAEVIHAFLRAIQSDPEQVVSDPETIGRVHLELGPCLARSGVADVDEVYEASYSPRPDDFHVVTRKRDGVDVIKIPLLKTAHRMAGVFYELLDDGIDDDQARAIIMRAVFEGLYDHSYKEKVSEIRFTNMKTKAKKKVPYV